MNELYRISLFGHRDFEDTQTVEKGIRSVLSELSRTKQFIEVYIGRNGEFDVFSASVIKRYQKLTDDRGLEITLVLPYTVKDVEYYQKYYDSITIPIKAHPKAAITLRNKWMIENSDLVLVYVINSRGGAFEAMRYAEKLNKKIINLATYFDTTDFS